MRILPFDNTKSSISAKELVDQISKKVPAQAKPAQAKSPYFLAPKPWSKPVKLNVGAPGYHQWRKSDPVAREFREAYAYHKKKGAKTFTWRVTNKKYKIP